MVGKDEMRTISLSFPNTDREIHLVCYIVEGPHLEVGVDATCQLSALCEHFIELLEEIRSIL